MKEESLTEVDCLAETDAEAMLGAALIYAGIGWEVFPVWPIRDGRCGCGKADCKSAGKHPIERLTGDWRLSATSDEEVIQSWWTEYSDANIATPGNLRIDVDLRHDALDTWRELLRTHGRPDTPHVFTPGGGEHWYFRTPTGWKHSNRTGNLPEGIDVRGHGAGYTLLPPSNHVNGRYEWEVSSSPDLLPIATLPDWLAEMLQPTQVEEAGLIPVTFSSNGSQKIDLNGFQLPELIRAIIERVPDKNTDRSVIDQRVIAALVRANASDDDIKVVFEQYPIGMSGKYAEKGKHGERYLAHSITKARQFVFGNAVEIRSRRPGEQTVTVSITEELPAVDMELLEKCLRREELGDGELFAALYSGRIVFDHAENAVNGWHFWNGHHWRRDDTAQIKPLFSAQLSAQYVLGASTCYKRSFDAREAGADGKAGKFLDLNEAMSQRARVLRKKARSRNVLDYSASLMGISGCEWDRKPLLLPVSNGVVNLKSGELELGNPQDYLRTAAPTEWRGLDESCPRFEKFVLEIMGGDEEMARFLQRLFGYSSSGLTAEHIFPILWGESGRNGKDTLLETLGYVLGPLAGAVAKDVILDSGGRRAGGSAEPHILDLRGKRLVWASEPHEGARLDSAQVKLITGGGRLKARPLYGSYVEWTPTHLATLVTNPRPHAAADDKALWSRILLIPFTQRFVEKPEGPNEYPADKQLKAKLQKEASGVLAWLVRGFLDWQVQGLSPPNTVAAATESYQRDEDTLGQFIAENCIEDDQAQAGASQLFSAYREWCEENSIRNPLDGRTFGMKMVQRYERRHTRNGKVYQGIGLLTA